jgi:hypothetical protein
VRACDMTDAEYRRAVADHWRYAAKVARDWGEWGEAEDIAQQLMWFMLHYRSVRRSPYRFAVLVRLSLRTVIAAYRERRRVAHRWGGRPLADYPERAAA